MVRLHDPAPLDPAVVRALLRAAAWQLGRGLWGGRRRSAAWRRRAAAIRDPGVRADALAALDGKRSFVDGAVLLWTLPGRPSSHLLRLLADFQIAANLLDQAGERGVALRGRTSATLTGALVDAVGGDSSDPYADHPWNGDDGYLAALVEACRAGCATLSRYAEARETLTREAGLVQALELTHHPDPAARDAALERFVASAHTAEDDDMRWFELAAADAAAMTVLVTLALAADPSTDAADREAAVRAYRWVAALSTMLDSFVDHDDDHAAGDWSAVAPYGDRAACVQQLAALVDRTLREVARLPNGPRHVVVVSAMVAMFLSARDVRADPDARTLVAAGGTLTRLLVPVLRLWLAVSGRRHRAVAAVGAPAQPLAVTGESAASRATASRHSAGIAAASSTYCDGLKQNDV